MQWALHVLKINLPSQPGPEVIKLFSCSTQLSMKFFLLINVKMPTIVGILTFMSRKNSILHLSEPDKSWISWYFYTYEQLKFHAQLSWAQKKFYNLRPWTILYPNDSKPKRKSYLTVSWFLTSTNSTPRIITCYVGAINKYTSRKEIMQIKLIRKISASR